MKIIHWLIIFSANYVVAAELSNSIFNDIRVEQKCIDIKEEIKYIESHTFFEDVPDINGKWISQRCEIRTGPEYVIRSYTFTNDTFKLIQFHYSDSSCTSAKWTIIALGHIKIRSKSILTPGGHEAEYHLNKISIIPYEAYVARELSRKVNSSCPGLVKKRWRPHKEYTILNLSHDEETTYVDIPWEQLRSNNVANKAKFKSRPHRSNLIDFEIDCVDKILPEIFHELQLISVQHKHDDSLMDSTKIELHLGDIHSRKQYKNSYRPTAYQPSPLLRSDKIDGCTLCSIVNRSTENSAPHLPATVYLPVILSGDFISQKCETLPNGLFTKRYMNFNNIDNTWSKDLEYYTELNCKNLVLTLYSTGSFAKPRKSSLIHGATEMKFVIESMSLAVHSNMMLDVAKSNCGGGNKNRWKLHKKQDITVAGCEALQIKVPKYQKELLKAEMDSKGNSILYMGQPDTERFDNEAIYTPTAYDYPLIKCKIEHEDTEINNDLFPVPYAQVASFNGITKLNSSFLFIFISIMVIIF